MLQGFCLSPPQDRWDLPVNKRGWDSNYGNVKIVILVGK